MIIKKILANSEGCKVKPKKETHLVAPLASTPKKSKYNIKVKLIIIPTMPRIVIFRKFKKDIIIIIKIAAILKNSCFFIKNKLSTLILLAIAGLADVVIIKPNIIRKKAKKKFILSISSHHFWIKFKSDLLKKLLLTIN